MSAKKPNFDVNVILKAHEALMNAPVPTNDRWMIDKYGKIIKIPNVGRGNNK